jgi:hypothetical protein
MRAGAVLLGLTLVGCTARVDGSPVTTTGRETPTGGAAAAMLGELTTIDPCSLTDLDVFDEFGAATFDVPASFDYCAIDTAIGGADVTVSVGTLNTLAEPPDATTKRVKDLDDDMYVIQPESTERHCDQELVFADQITLRVSADIFTDAPTDLCPMVAAVMDKVIDVVEQGPCPTPGARGRLADPPRRLLDDLGPHRHRAGRVHRRTPARVPRTPPVLVADPRRSGTVRHVSHVQGRLLTGRTRRYRKEHLDRRA